MKTNELAKDFIDANGFELFSKLLEKECIDDYQIAYNVICTLWVLSYHSFAAPGFEDFRVFISIPFIFIVHDN
jgi:hypothetical protein